MPDERPGQLMRAYLFMSAAWIALPILVIQNLLGMHLNLWLDFSNYDAVPRAFSSFPTLGVHVAVGVLIVAIASTRFALGLTPSNRPFRIPSVFIFVFSLLAFFSGVEFTFLGQNDIFSFLMELGFGGIVVSVAALVYVGSRLQRAQARAETPQATQK